MNMYFRIMLLGCMLIFPYQSVFSQVSITTNGAAPDNSSMLDIKSTSKGVLIPRMTMEDRNAISSPASGLMIYQTDNNPGFYFNSGNSSSPVWEVVATKAYVDALIDKLIQGKIDVADGEGNIYSTVKIGTLVWMAENLKTTKYNDGTDIPNVTINTAWAASTTGAYCWYNNDETANKVIYGALYNWYAVNTGKLCPVGWRVPCDAEWDQLARVVSDRKGPYTYDGTIWENVGRHLKAAGTIEDGNGLWRKWNDSPEGTDDFGFSGLPGGIRSSLGTFDSIGSGGLWWSSTEYPPPFPWIRYLNYTDSNIRRVGSYKEDGLSVRCVRDN
jgi:uncharacterized protein (TIGR02145 family)